MVRTLARSLLVAGALGFSALVPLGSANASTLIEFNGATGNPFDGYTEGDYFFQPASGTNDVKCADGRCLKEITQGTVTTMVRSDVVGGLFDLDSFYFALVGQGNTPGIIQTITVSGYLLGSLTASLTFTLGELLTAHSADATVTRFDPPAVTNPDTITKNDGFTVSLLAGLFHGVDKVTWSTNTNEVVCKKEKGEEVCNPADAQARLDNVLVDHSAYDPSPSEVPVPAALPLLFSGLLGMGVLGRLRRRAA